MPEPVVLFDGECVLCHRSVRFILRHEREPVLKFAALQSDTGKALLAKAHLPEDLNAMAFLEGDKSWTGPDGVLEVCRYLKAPARWLRAFRIFPSPIRRTLYRFIARRRFHWFGRLDTCSLPSPDDSARFLS